MKTTSFIRMLALLAIALVMSCSMDAKEKKSNVKNQKAVIENIMTRTSVRQYLDKAVPDDIIETLLRAGMAAPTAVNKQPWHFVVVTDRQVLDGLAQANPNARMAARAPLAIVVCGDMNKALKGDAREFWVQDASAATENILLAAHGVGLGAVWTGTYPNQQRCAAVSKVLALPETIIPLCTIVIGYPAKAQEPKDKWKPENVSWNQFGGKK